MSGGSRGIGPAVAVRAAAAGANIALIAKTGAPHPKLPGTIHTAAAEIEAAGGATQRARPTAVGGAVRCPADRRALLLGTCATAARYRSEAPRRIEYGLTGLGRILDDVVRRRGRRERSIRASSSSRRPRPPGRARGAGPFVQNPVAESASSGEIRTAVDVDVGTGHIRVAPGGEKGDHRADFLW